MVAVAVIGYVGVGRWSGFPFTPSHLLFLLPFFLLLLVKGIEAGYHHAPVIVACILVLYLSADYSYFAKVGYLNKAYCVPYEMASVIRKGSSPEGVA